MDKLQQAAYRSLQDMDRRGMFTTDAHLHLSSWNRWLEEHSGLSRADVLGRPLLKLFPKSAARLEPLYRQALEDQVVVISPRLHRYLLPLPPVESRGERYMRQSARILPLHGDGGVIGTLTLIEDVSERFLREGELRQHIDRLQDTEKALRRQERQFRALVEANQDLVMALEDNGDIRYLSPSVVSLLGDQAKLNIARRLPGLIHPQDRFAVIKIFREVRHAANLAQTRQFRLRSPQGDWRMIEATFQNLAGHAEDAGIAVYGRDITARKQAEEALRLREAKLTSIFRAAPVGIGLVKNRVLTEVNEQICHLTGYSREELLGQSARLVYPSQEEFEVVGQEKYRQIQETGMGTVETRWRRKDGTIIDVMLSSTPLVPGDLAGDITFTALNITQLKRAMEELKLKERLLDGASDSIFLHDLEGHFLYLNQAAYRERGYEKEELLATDLTALITPEFARMRESLLTDLVAQGEIIFESAHRRKDGSVMPVEIHARTIDLRDQQLILSAARDITERKQGEQKIKELNVLLKAIKEINEALLRVKSEPDLFQQTCDLLMQAPNIRFTWIGLVQPGSFEIKPVAWAGYEAGYLSDLRVTWDDSLQGGGAIGNAIRTGQPGVIEDIAGDPRALPWREAALKRGYSYMLALPLVHEDQTMGTLNVYSEKQKVFREDEIEFLQQVAGDIAVGIKSLRLAQGLERSVKQLQAVMQQTVEAITFLAEMRDPYTAGHQQNVTRLALALARELGLDEARCEGLRVAGLLHDIGKIAVPAEILSKPGKLSKMEFTIIKNHSHAGYDILKKIEFPWPVAQIVLQHHERWNGSGYPQGLAGQDILPEARILAVVDVVEAMASHRPYRPALGIDQALEEIARNKGILYDPEAVDACIELFTENKFTLE